MKSSLSALAVCCAAFLSAAAARHEPFDEGERVVCLGDSITHGGMYPYYLQFAQLLRHPGSTARVFNAGHSGGTCGGALKRWPWDVEPMKGTLTFLVFGMNDVNHSLYMPEASGPSLDDDRRKAVAAYAENERRMSDIILGAGGRLALVTPPPYDEYGKWQKTEPRAGCNERGLAACAKEVRALAAEKNLRVVELHRPLTAALKRGDGAYRLADRIHPDPKSHLAILGEFLRALDVSPEVASVTISADGKTVDARHAKVSAVRADKEGVEFCYAPESLPFPDFDGWREPLRVTGLADGAWEVRAASVRIGVFSAGQLAEGIDLARLDTPSMAQARRALERMLKWRRLDSSRRNLVKMDIRAQDLGADPRDFKASCAAIDYWYSRHGSKGSNAGYYANLIRTYKDNATNRTVMASAINRQLDELVRITRPEPFSIAVRRLDGLVSAGKWSAKFYVGMEANGEVSVNRKGYRGQVPSVDLRHIHGATKFGAEAAAKTALRAPVDWTVSAEVKCDPGGEAGVSMEFFDSAGKSLGVRDGVVFKDGAWTLRTWKFKGPVKAASAKVHILSLAHAPVSFANVCVSSEQGKQVDELPFAAYALPSTWNRAWNGGREEFTSFADAPLPMMFHFKGERARLKRPLIRIEFPAELEIRDAFCSHAEYYGAEKPIPEGDTVRDGVVCRQVRFENLKAFEIMRESYGWERKLGVVLAPRIGTSAAGRSYRIYWHIADGDRKGSSGCVVLRFAVMPKGLREPKEFFVFSWQSNDRLYSNNEALLSAARAWEAAGLTTFVRPSSTCARAHEIMGILAKRPAPWRFTLTFSDSWNTRFLDADSDEFKALGVRMAERNDGKKMSEPLLCPDYFNNDPRFHAYYRDHVVLPRLRDVGVRAGDMVSGDLEPWGAKNFCTCRRCLEAFARFAGLDEVPGPKDVLGMRDRWASFRCHQTEMSVAKLAKIVREYDPGVKVVDYDYVIWYGTDSEKAFSRGCSKNAAMDDKWIDAHLCSYYHICDKTAFDAIRNNTAKLAKPYIPLGAIAGAGSYLRDGEVRNPAQIRQLALAAAVHGCPGIGFYKGIHLDGEHMLALMKARDEIAAVERFPWGRATGALEVRSDGAKFAWASSAADGREIVALFNYDAKSAVTATVAASNGGAFSAVDPVSGVCISKSADLGKGISVDVPAADVRFIVFKPLASR